VQEAQSERAGVKAGPVTLHQHVEQDVTPPLGDAVLAVHEGAEGRK